MKVNDIFNIKTDMNKFSYRKTDSDNNKFSNLLDSISKKEHEVSQMNVEFLNGNRDDIQNILIEGQKLNLEINFALQVRNNLVNAFQQLMTMQV